MSSTIIDESLLGKGCLYPAFTISLHLTDLCNSNCIFCGEDSHSHVIDTIASQDLLEFMRNNYSSKWNSINIHGGEPTIRKDFLSILEAIRNVGYRKIILQTNGLRLSDIAFARDVFNIGIDIFTMGFHGNTEESMEMVTNKKGSFKSVMKAIENINTLNGYLRATVVACKLNYKLLPKIAELLSQNNFKHVNFSAMQPGGSAFNKLDTLMISYDEIYPYLSDAINYAASKGLQITLEGFPYCAAKNYEKYQIDWDTQHLKVFYRGRVFDNFNKFLNVTMRAKGESCKKCMLRNSCGGPYRDYVSYYGWNNLLEYK